MFDGRKGTMLLALAVVLLVASEPVFAKGYSYRPTPRYVAPPPTRQIIPKPIAPKRLAPKQTPLSALPKPSSQNSTPVTSKGKTGEQNAKSALQAQKLKKELNGKEVSAALAEKVKESGVAIAGNGTNEKLKVANRLSRQYGGTPSDWTKKSSSAYIDRDGRRHSLHWYENIKTKQKVEQKPVADRVKTGRITND